MDHTLALILGIVQGLTEFLPISSSGHLSLIQRYFTSIEVSRFLLFNLVCHLGTLLAICYAFWKDILLLTHLTIRQLCIATMPLVPLVLIHKEIKMLFNQPALLGIDFLITALFLFVGSKVTVKEAKRPYFSACMIGLTQTLALLPGISRSGSTISCAKILGWKDEEAIRFSFLLAIPTIVGATILETIDLLFKKSPYLEIFAIDYAIGFFASLIFGVLSINLLKRLGMKTIFRYFAIYCSVLGVVTLWLR